MTTTGFLGMRGDGDWATDQRPKGWREGMLLLFPNGDVSLTAISSKGRSQRVTDPEYNYFTKTLPVQGADGAQDPATTGNVYTDATLVDLVSTNQVAGQTIYYKVGTASAANHFRDGHTVHLVDKSIDSNNAFGEVTGKATVVAGTYIAIRLLADATSAKLILCDYADIAGNVNAEGAFIPDALAYDPTKRTNFTQIFRTSLDITRTAKLTRLRTGDAYMEAKREAMLLHGMEIEMSAFLGEKTNTTGDNGKPKRTTQGGISFIREHQSGNVLHYPTSHTGVDWLVNGEEWIDTQLELVFRYGRRTKLAFCGSGALLGIQRLAKQSGQFSFTPETGAYGIQVVRWTTPFGTLLLKVHPLFTFRTYRTNSMFIYEPENLSYNFITDTIFKKDDGLKKGGTIGYDGTKEEFLTEAGWEWHFPETMMYLTGVGLNG